MDSDSRLCYSSTVSLFKSNWQMLRQNCLLLKKEKLRLVSNGISVHLGVDILKLASGSWGNYEL